MDCQTGTISSSMTAQYDSVTFVSFEFVLSIEMLRNDLVNRVATAQYDMLWTPIVFIPCPLYNATLTWRDMLRASS